MLVKSVEPYRWARDPEVSELIDYLDRHLDKHRKPTASYQDSINLARAALSKNELRSIVREYELCRADFSYAARNYFWIEDKETRGDILFRLWPSQELILESINELKGKGISQRILIIKSRQLGCSTVIEGLGAWRTIFFTNINGLIISHDPDHAAYLFGITQKIYDMLPWWLKPRCSSREFKTGLILDNPEYAERYDDPGMNSKIIAMGANATTKSAQGRRISWAHLSETSSWPEYNAREIIEEDVVNALSDGPETFAVIETTPKGAGTYMHWKWLEAVRLGDRAEWQPRYFPWFFDASHSRPAEEGWKPTESESRIRSRAEKDWVRCDFKECHQYHPRKKDGKDRSEEQCPTCRRGTLKPHIIPDEQLKWMEWKRENAEGDDEALKKLRQEQSSTAEESFVSSGIEIFSQKALIWAQMTTDDPVAEGHLDQNLRFHGVNPETGKCWLDGCGANHRNDDKSLKLWEWPQPGAEYNLGADVSHGLGGKEDYSTVCVLRVDRRGGPDVQVAAWARNDTDAISFATVLNKLGNYFGQCQIAVEMNLPTTAHILQAQLQYPRLYQSKSTTNASLVTQRFGWLTTRTSKPSLYQSLRKSLEDRMIVLRDRALTEELKTFKYDADSASKVGAATGFKDDRAIAAMISHFTAHDSDWDEDAQTFIERIPLSLENAPWIFRCLSCFKLWPAQAVADYRNCKYCRNMNITADRNQSQSVVKSQSDAADDASAGAAREINDHVWEEYGVDSWRETWGNANVGPEERDTVGVPDYDSL